MAWARTPSEALRQMKNAASDPLLRRPELRRPLHQWEWNIVPVNSPIEVST
jgi:hypothetical protein